MNKTDSFVQDVSHWSNAISTVAISLSNTTCRLLGDILLLINVITFQGGGYLGYSALIEISEKIFRENFQNRKIWKIFGSFNYEPFYF